MQYISRIEIQYFRSIYKMIINDLKDLNVICGKNDVGKSNVLKALNLFFNNETDFHTLFDFETDFNVKRLEEVRKDSIKGKQFIQIKITFLRGESASKTLPEKFTITKKWLRNDFYPSIQTNDINNQIKNSNPNLEMNSRNKSSLTAYQNKLKYIYIPAIKEKDIFKEIINELQYAIFGETLSRDKELKKALDSLSSKVTKAADDLNVEFKKATGIQTMLTSPRSLMELYNSLEVDTESDVQSYSISLDKRGDGIRVRYIPSILNFIAKSSSKKFIWGFEEPENSVEFNLAIEMADAFQKIYAKNSMIFATTHSAAFINLIEKENVRGLKCYKKELRTEISPVKTFDSDEIAEELGYIKIQQEAYKLYLQKKKELESKNTELIYLNEKISRYQKPILLTEGESDELILKQAWIKLYDYECPFEIESCNIMSVDQQQSAAGCDMLKFKLCSHRYNDGKIIIGLFDRDEEGIKAYKGLSNNFLDEGKFKKCKNEITYALLIPTNDSTKNFDDYCNLSIEFNFEEQYLHKKIDGKGLILKNGTLKKIFNNKVVEESETNVLYAKKIIANKMYFAEKIVPMLPKEAFKNFENLFEIITNDILAINP